MLMTIQVVQLIGFAFLMSLGQLLLKKTALVISNIDNFSIQSLGLYKSISLLFQIPWLYLALLIYLFAITLWLYILQKVPLSIAYPFSALAMIIVPVAASQIFSERLSFSYWVGAILIIIGIIIIAR